MAQFGDLLAELRQDRGLTQSELGKVISVTSGTISNYEHGFHLPDLEKLVLLADYFGVSTDYLLGRISSNLPIVAKGSHRWDPCFRCNSQSVPTSS